MIKVRFFARYANIANAFAFGPKFNSQPMEDHYWEAKMHRSWELSLNNVMQASWRYRSTVVPLSTYWLATISQGLALTYIAWLKLTEKSRNKNDLKFQPFCKWKIKFGPAVQQANVPTDTLNPEFGVVGG